MSKVTLYTLAGCKNCEQLKAILEDIYLEYKEVICTNSSNDSECERVESAIGCDTYPVAVVEKDTKLYINYCGSGNDLMVKKRLSSGAETVTVMNTLQMVELILKNK
jgi:glutaredoxin